MSDPHRLLYASAIGPDRPAGKKLHVYVCKKNDWPYATYSSGLVGEVHPFPRSYMFSSEASFGLSVPAANVRGNEGGGGGAVLVVRVEKSVHLTVHTSRSASTAQRIGLLQLTRILNNI
jgi:hypothetical protein